jgi:hypothetical protein
MPSNKKVLSKNINDFVINPKTGRLIKINSRIYRQLLKDNMLNLDFNTRKNNIVYNDTDINKNKLKKNENLSLVYNNGKIKEYRRKITQEEANENLIKNASTVVKKNLHLFNDSMTEQETYDLFKKLTSQQLIGEPPPIEEPKVKIITNSPESSDTDDSESSDEEY